MSVVASLRGIASILPFLPTSPVTLKEVKVTPQIWVSHKWNLRLGLVSGHLSVGLGVLMLLIFLPSMYCQLESMYYSFHEIIIPKRLTVQERDKPVEKLSYMVLMQGQKQLVHLKVKRDYFVNDFPVYSYHNGMPRQEIPFLSQDCHYEGYIEGVPGSFVSVNTCSGLRGVLIKEETSYSIEPLLSSKGFEHVLYIMVRQPRVFCSVTSKDSQAVASQQQKSRKPLDNLWSHTKYVEMFVVVNHQRFHMWRSNMSVTVQAVVDIIALANSFTRGINTVVVLMGMEIWTEGDLIEVPVDLQVTLRNFNRWRQEQLWNRAKHDVAHMIVGHQSGEYSGQAFLGGACSSGFAAAVESFHHEDVLLFAALMVHELGHNLGIQHDLPACLCKDRHFCLMHENITKESGFSNCSSDYFHRFLQDHKGACLFNKPWSQSHQRHKRREAQCGNGVVEEKEECDCGSACDSHPCCEPTCTLKEGAECGDGLCCHKCNFKKKGVLCRPDKDVCDLPEYCNGTSGECPANSYKQDGTPCDRIYYCSGGQCRNPDKQCTDIYGYPARSAPKDCYISMNTKGNRFGNCGLTTGSNSGYGMCTDDDIFCGKLICTGVDYLPPVKPQHTLIQVPYGEDWCWSMDAYNTTDIPDYGDVQSGTYCAPNKVCMDYTCTDHTILQYNCEPQDMCHGKGVCNNLRHCHCDDGFAPPDCRSPGNGGSVDSGPVGKLLDQNFSVFSSSSGGKRMEEDEMDMKVVLLVVPIFLVLLLCGLMLIAYLWSEVQSVVGSSSSSSTSLSESSTPPEQRQPGPAEKAPPPPAGEAPPPPTGEA
ncbi:disintegrin and metalloproteinase domain-containing protein 1-like [Nannospalax galili]|uniref:disintegrin and metalloproteinase domain-containing protein 1-like n=1 Tax=Nannospalax galili TaxID=1026970 RepID=UPI0004ED1136|nr:disintegrin and metalloproteinase domain-containing protein 1-like [Nannospalax galili]